MINKFDGEYFFLSNFYPCSFKYRGQLWPSSEHAYQAMKLDSTLWPYMAGLRTASISKKEGRRLKCREDWNQVKLSFMEAIVREKFCQNVELMQKLQATGDQELIEGNWWGDTYWGVCRGVGQNHLGKILMKIRDEYK